jgi:hypothetical protein
VAPGLEAEGDAAVTEALACIAFTDDDDERHGLAESTSRLPPPTWELREAAMERQ